MSPTPSEPPVDPRDGVSRSQERLSGHAAGVREASSKRFRRTSSPRIPGAGWSAKLEREYGLITRPCRRTRESRISNDQFQAAVDSCARSSAKGQTYQAQVDARRDTTRTHRCLVRRRVRRCGAGCFGRSGEVRLTTYARALSTSSRSTSHCDRHRSRHPRTYTDVFPSRSVVLRCAPVLRINSRRGGPE